MNNKTFPARFLRHLLFLFLLIIAGSAHSIEVSMVVMGGRINNGSEEFVYNYEKNDAGTIVAYKERSTMKYGSEAIWSSLVSFNSETSPGIGWFVDLSQISIGNTSTVHLKSMPICGGFQYTYTGITVQPFVGIGACAGPYRVKMLNYISISDYAYGPTARVGITIDFNRQIGIFLMQRYDHMIIDYYDEDTNISTFWESKEESLDADPGIGSTMAGILFRF